MIDCRNFTERLGQFLEGKISAGEKTLFEEHLRRCDRCGELAAIHEEGKDRFPVEPPAGMVEAILRDTGGSPCAGARQQLAEYQDGSLGRVDSDLVGMHLEGCGDCAALSLVLARMAADLPLLAEMETDDRFVPDVLAGTVFRPKKAALLAGRIAAGWKTLLARPRFAWEGAYIGTFLFVLAFGIPSTPLAEGPRRALDFVKSSTAASLRQPVAKLEDRMAYGVGEVKKTWVNIDEGVAVRTQEYREELSRFLGTFWAGPASEQATDQAGPSQAGRDRNQEEEKGEEK